jgi:hypothetical protein
MGDGRFLIYLSHTNRNNDYFTDTELSQEVLTGVNMLQSVEFHTVSNFLLLVVRNIPVNKMSLIFSPPFVDTDEND